MPLPFATLAVIGGGLADILIGMAIAFRGTARIGLQAALVVSCAYLAGATLFAADIWLDPLGPMLKVFPAMALALVALAVLEDR